MKTEPTLRDLAAIEAEWPVIEAEIAVVDAECRLAASVDAVSVRAHRRAVARLSRLAAARSAGPARAALVAVGGAVVVPAVAVQPASA